MLHARLSRRLLSVPPRRPFRVLGLQQVAIGSLSKGRLTSLWQGLLGLPKLGSFKSESENVDEDILQLGRGPTAVELDLMTPIDPDKAPKVHVPPLNHIGLWVRAGLAQRQWGGRGRAWEEGEGRRGVGSAGRCPSFTGRSHRGGSGAPHQRGRPLRGRWHPEGRLWAPGRIRTPERCVRSAPLARMNSEGLQETLRVGTGT